MRYQAIVGILSLGFVIGSVLLIAGILAESRLSIAAGSGAIVILTGAALLLLLRYARLASAKAAAAERVASATVKRVQKSLNVELPRVRKDLRSEVNDVLETHLTRFFYRHRHDVIRDTAALLTLHDLNPVEGEHVPLTSWSALPATVLMLVQHVRDLPAGATVVELGSGASTVWMALEAKRRQAGIRIVSFDHDEDFARLTRRALEQNGVADYVDLRVEPLEMMTTTQGEQLWYAASGWTALRDIALVFVDGPPGVTGPLARHPAVEALGPRLAPGAVIVIDDVDRDDERMQMAAWLELGTSGDVAQLLEIRENAAALRIP